MLYKKSSPKTVQEVGKAEAKSIYPFLPCKKSLFDIHVSTLVANVCIPLSMPVCVFDKGKAKVRCHSYNQRVK